MDKIANFIVILMGAGTAILTFIEKCEKIKWKPLSMLFGMNDISDKIDSINTQLDSFHKEIDKIAYVNDVREMKRLRSKILTFASQKCEQGLPMTSEQEAEFDDNVKDYEELIKKHNLQNGHTTQSIKLVSDYRKMELADKYKNNVKHYAKEKK